MKNTITTKLLTALTVTLLSQPIFATDSDTTDNCYVDTDTKDLILDVKKFTTVWMKLKKDNSKIANDKNSQQKHLEKYIEEMLQDNEGKLDVAKFSALWKKAGNNKNTDSQKHLQDALVVIVEKASCPKCDHKK